MDKKGYIFVIIAVGIISCFSGCTSLAYDDHEFIQTWNQYVDKYAKFRERFNVALEKDDFPLALAILKEQGRYASDTYKKLDNYRVSTDYEDARYYFAYHLRNQIDCCNQAQSYLKGMSEGDASYIKNEEYYLGIMEIPCNAAEKHFKEAFDSFPSN